MLEHHVCGIIMAPVAGTNPAVFARLKHLNVPCVLIGREISGARVDYIGTDFQWGTKMAVRHLADQGHKHIALLGGTPHTSAYNERLAGYLEGLEESRIPTDQRNIIPGRLHAKAALSLLISSSVRTSCLQRRCAITILSRLASSSDLGKIGLSPARIWLSLVLTILKEAATANPGLTTVAVGSGQWGIEAANLLHQRISAENTYSGCSGDG